MQDSTQDSTGPINSTGKLPKDTFKHRTEAQEQKDFMEGKVLITEADTQQKEKDNERQKKMQSFKPQGTFYALYPTWTHNNLQNRESISPEQDIKTIPKRTIKEVLIIGSGYTLTDPNVLKSLKQKAQDKANHIILAAHSNISFLFHEGIIPDYIFETDCSPKISEQLDGALALPLAEKVVNKENKNTSAFILATHVSPVTVSYCQKRVGSKNVFFYKPYVSSVPESTVYNNIQTLLNNKIKSYLLQAGCVTNGMLILSEYLFKQSIWSFNKVSFYGVDYCYFPPDGGRCPRYTYDQENHKLIEQTHEISPIVKRNMFNYSGYWTTDKDLAYAYDFMNLTEGITRNWETREEKFQVEVYGDSLARRFCLFR